ncbi:MAG: tryptophan synthase subunit alpha [Synergistaceae bacterium]|nr:tryptophan synthase subunit alpha [Synergistaceae bacterium]
MNRVSNAFLNKNGKAFIGFLTAGDPDIKSSERFILEMEKAGADLIEIGVPFSDPIAEGKVIEAANARALSCGTTTDTVFELVRNLRAITQIPLVLLTYLNPVFKYGYESFFECCNSVGVDGIIIPDLPHEEKGELTEHARKNDVRIISLIAPTSKERIKRIAESSSGFIYLVSSMGVTGVRDNIDTDLESIIKDIRAATDTPVAIGFGISTPEQAKALGGISDGVIVGSAIVKIIERHGVNAAPYLYDYVKSIKCELI